jgi:acetylornithine deacetylase/succinyl-diaminopimelate desuccinylase-like protein
MLDTTARAVLDSVDANRVASLALDLVRIRSYTGETIEATEFYVDRLRRSGLSVEVYRDFPRSPSVVGRLAGRARHPALELNAHVDTIPVDHRPAEIRDGVLYGRGATDMKGGLAAITEAAWAIQDARVQLGGDLLVSTHGRHELPTGRGEDLVARVKHGVHGDAAIVAECGSHTLPIVGLGMAMWEITIRRDGDVDHENSTPRDTPHPILAGARLVRLIEERARILAENVVAYAGPESLFVGEFHGGDFYNRFPNVCRIVGTRRWAPEVRFEDTHDELQELCDRVAREYGLRVELAMQKTRDGFRVAEDDRLVKVVRDAYQKVTGHELPFAGLRSVADASVFNTIAGIPALYHGPGGTGHHGDVEAMPVDELVRAAKVLALCALAYCGQDAGG